MVSEQPPAVWPLVFPGACFNYAMVLQGDFMLSQEVQLTNHGKSEVHLTGYQTTTDVLDPEADLESEEDDDDPVDLEQTLVGLWSCLRSFLGIHTIHARWASVLCGWGSCYHTSLHMHSLPALGLPARCQPGML